jgi:NO-binding membrane sensor protein with MHYT domain
MDSEIPGVQNYNGGIIFVSYLISVIGAMTALELLQRRTHIRGEYNWYIQSFLMSKDTVKLII